MSNFNIIVVEKIERDLIKGQEVDLTEDLKVDQTKVQEAAQMKNRK
jgi:hypothetical protein